jgi:hypothetical protein
VVPGRVELEHLVIQDVREPGHGMPVGQVVAGEGPSDRIRTEPVLDVRIAHHVGVIIHGEERMMMNRQVSDESYSDQGSSQSPWALC